MKRQDWVEHFEDSDNYKNSTLTNRAVHLTRHLSALNVKWRGAMKLLVDFESKQSSTETNEVGRNEVERMDDIMEDDEALDDSQGESLGDSNSRYG